MDKELLFENVKLLIEFKHNDTPTAVVLNFHIHLDVNLDADGHLENIFSNTPVKIKSARFEHSIISLGSASSKDTAKFKNLVMPNFTMEDIAYAISKSVIGLNINNKHPSFEWHNDKSSNFKILEIEKILEIA